MNLKKVSTVRGKTKFVLVNGLIAAGCISSMAAAQSIYTCVDGNGRKLTSDRPIAECTDRIQRELSPQGTTRRVMGPTLTAQELAAQEQKEKAAADVRNLALEEKRRDRALRLRYPTKAVHDRERAQAIEQINEVIKASAKRSQELAEQRATVNLEMDFYKKDPGKAPAAIKRRLEENDSSMAAQKSFLIEQDFEKQRVNLRFDDELVKLNQLWEMSSRVGATPTAALSPAPAVFTKSEPKKP